MEYIKHFPKPVLDDLVTGRWLPVVGAGLSLNAITPPDKKMPLWSDLSAKLVAELGDFSPTSLLDGISAYEHEFGRARLIEKLSEILLIKDSKPGIAHKEFCTIPFDIVCTTNFDFLLERQYDLIPRDVNPVIDEEQLSISNGNAGTQLLKLHGDLRHPSRLVVTEADYDGFLSRFPLLATYLSNQLITKTAVFIGYSLEDPDFRQIWHVVTQRLGRTRRQAYAILVDARPADITRYERRGVKVIKLPGNREQYGNILAYTFRELREYMRDHTIAVSKVTEERPLRELLLPRDASNRLCFFSLPLELLSFYRERVFPRVEEIGFVPVTADDVVTPGDSISAKIDALIYRSSVMVTELTSSWTLAEYRMAIGKIKDTGDKELQDKLHNRHLRLIVILSEGEQPPPSVQHVHVIRRPNIMSADSESFIDELATVLSKLASEFGLERPGEPLRLLNVKEYRAAVISAMTLLESKLRERLDISSQMQYRRPMSLRALIDLGVKQQVINEQMQHKLYSWMKIRNEAVHLAVPISRTQASEIVNSITKLIDKFTQ